jgi:hypothetical protein
MPDYDVGAINLSVPPASAVLQQYRPAVLVRNNGVHDALASGTLRIYGPAGLLIFTTEIYSGTIAPGNSEPAQATDYWTPPAIGRYQVIAYVSCPLDQYEPNNNLAPCFVNVTGAPPPPAPTVPLHAAQHEDGGSDELNADGLRGKLADAQTALAHKTSHQVAGSDTLDLTGMLGVLGTPQPIADHHLTHEHGGGDRLYVGGLNGQLADSQPALIHDNAKHDPNYTTVTEFGNHLADTTKVHELASNLEQVPNKGKPGHYPELDGYGHVPAAQLGIETTPPRPDDAALLHNNTWEYPKPAVHDNDQHAAEYEDTANKGVADGYPELDASGFIPTSQLGASGTSPPVPSPNVLHDDQCFYESAPALHSTSHQDGGGDEISIAGLVGKAADAQDPVGHHVSHEPGGSDPISGVPSVPTLHAASHESEGSDEISIAGLAGIAADIQKTGFAAANNYYYVPLEHNDPETQIASLLIPAAQWHGNTSAVLRSFLQVQFTNAPDPFLTIRLKAAASEILSYDWHFDPTLDSSAILETLIVPSGGGFYAVLFRLVGCKADSSPFVVVFHAERWTTPTTDLTLHLSAEPHWTDPTTVVNCKDGHGLTTSHVVALELPLGGTPIEIPALRGYQ